MGSSSDESADQLIVECPGCHKRYRLPAEQAGRRVRCRCGQDYEAVAIYELADLVDPVDSHAGRPFVNPDRTSARPESRSTASRNGALASRFTPCEGDRVDQVVYELRHQYRLGLVFTSGGLAIVPLTLLPVSWGEWFSPYGAGSMASSFASVGFAAGWWLVFFGVFFLAIAKGRSGLWCFAGVFWGLGAVVVHLLPDRRRVARESVDNPDTLAERIKLEVAYTDLPWYRRHALSGTLVCAGLVWVGVATGIQCLSRINEDVTSDVTRMTLRACLFTPIFFGLPLLLMLTGEVYLPPRPGKRRLVPWGSGRRLAVIISFGLWIVALLAVMFNAVSPSGARPADSAATRSPRDVAEAVEAAMYERWGAMAQLTGNPDHDKHVVRVEIDGFDPDEGVWVGRIESDLRGRSDIREFEAMVDGDRVDLDIYDQFGMGRRRTIHELKIEGQFVPSSMVLDRGPPG